MSKRKHDCDRMDGLLSRRLDGDLGSGESRRLAEHLEGCTGCRELASVLERVRSRLEEAIPGGPSPDFYRRFFDALPASSCAPAGPPARTSYLGPTVRVPLAAVAAGLAVVAAALAWPLLRGGEEPTPEKTERPADKIRVIQIEPEDVVATYQHSSPEPATDSKGEER